jgi:hypothetical protein
MRNVVLLVAVLLAARSAHADLETLRLEAPAPTSAPAAVALGNARLEIWVGATLIFASVLSIVGDVAFAMLAIDYGALHPDCGCLAFIPYLIGVGVDAAIKSIVGVVLVSIGAKRRSDSLRYSPTASASSRGGSVGLSLAW